MDTKHIDGRAQDATARGGLPASQEERNQTCQHLDGELVASRSVRKQTSVVEATHLWSFIVAALEK